MSLHNTSISMAFILLKWRGIGQNLTRIPSVLMGLLCVVFLVVPSLGHTNELSTPQFLKGSIFEQVGNDEGVAPSLLYALALVESGRAIGNRKDQVTPSRYVLRALDARYYAENKQDYLVAYKLFVEKYGDRFDVGPLQVNVYWQVSKAKRLASGEELLDLETNLRIGAQVLREAMASTKDEVLGVGRYHTWSDEERSRLFGKRVLSVQQNLIKGS